MRDETAGPSHPRSQPYDDRRLLMNLAYRLLGSLSDAEDAVQETYVRWYAQPESRRAAIDSSTAWMVTVCSRICLDLLGSARARREQYVGEWVPEPVPAHHWSSRSSLGDAEDPADLVTADESVRMAFLVVLEEMTAAERVAFVLHDVFRYSFAEIADVVGRTPHACRQLASSARRRVEQQRPGRQPRDEHAGLVEAFRSAWRSGDIGALVGVLDPAAVGVVDGGGLVSASVEPLVGSAAVADFFVHVLDRQPDLELDLVVSNGEPALLGHAAGRPLAVVHLDVRDGVVVGVWAVRNPEKLRAWRVPG